MAEYIECLGCNSPYCGGCNIYTLSKMLQHGKFDCLMNDDHSINSAADVVEVRHGYWISGQETVCSVCKIDDDVYDVERFNYCPNCGAKMDGKEVEE